MAILGVLVGTKVILSHYELDMLINFGIVSFALLVLFILAKLKENILFTWQTWFGVALLLSVYLLQEWPRPANHLYVYIYMSLILFVVFLNDKTKHNKLLEFNLTALFAVIMTMAIIQKLITPEYMNGTTNTFWLLGGGFFELIGPSGEWKTAIESNKALLNDYFNNYPHSTHKIRLQSPVSNIKEIAIAFNAVVLISELFVLLLFIFSNNQKVKHFPLILLILLIYLTRQESTFLSLLAIIGAANSSSSTKFRFIYLLIFLLLQLTILLDVGYI